VTRDSSRAVWLQQAHSHLRHADPVLAPPMDLFGALLFQVTGQQLSFPRPAGPWPASRPVRRPSPLLTELSAVDLLSERGEAESIYRESIAHLERTRVREQPNVVPICLRGNHTGSATATSSRRAANLTALRDGDVGVGGQRGRSGPCCSVEPTETASRTPAAASRSASGR
jgi:hypothetical protein